jgi:hypothetical protein
MQAMITWFVVVGALVIAGAYIALEIWAHRQNNDEKIKVSDKLDSLVKSQKELNTTICELIKRIDERWTK